MCVKTWRNQTQRARFILQFAVSAFSKHSKRQQREAALFVKFYINANNFLINIELNSILCKILMATFKPVIAEINSTLLQTNSILI